MFDVSQASRPTNSLVAGIERCTVEPISLLIIVVVALASGTTGAVVALNWDKIVIWWKGKKIAILGATATGKSTLDEFLREGTIPTQYDPTLGTVPSEAKRIRIRDLDLLVKKGADVGGRMQTRDREWKKIVDEAEVILYLVRAHELLSQEHKLIARIKEDTQMIATWVREIICKNAPSSILSDPKQKEAWIRGNWKLGPKVVIVGTHADLDERFKPSSRESLEEAFEQNASIREIATQFGGTEQTLIILGSLKTLDDSQRLVYALFKQLGG